jgi:hypothetical protein
VLCRFTTLGPGRNGVSYIKRSSISQLFVSSSNNVNNCIHLTHLNNKGLTSKYLHQTMYIYKTRQDDTHEAISIVISSVAFVLAPESSLRIFYPCWLQAIRFRRVEQAGLFKRRLI